MEISFNVNADNLKGFNLSEKGVLRAVNASINRALDSMKTQLARETVTRYYLTETRYYVTASAIKKTLNARTTTVAGVKQGIIISRAPRLNLANFKISPRSASYRMRGRSYQAAVKQEGGMKTLAANVFYIPGRKRMYKRVRPGGKGFQNIRAIFGPAIPQMLKNEETFEAVKENTERVFNERLSHEIQRLLLA